MRFYKISIPAFLIIAIWAMFSFENRLLKESLQKAEQERIALIKECATKTNNLVACNEAIVAQNIAIKKLQTKPAQLDKDFSHIEKIYIQDHSCEAELEAYKKLFRDENGH